MNHYEKIADDIRAVLTSDSEPQGDNILELDRQYSNAVTELNERLRACMELLGKGLRTEAIRKCEEEPILLDAVAVIGFPESDLWSDYAKQVGATSGSKLRTDMAERLNDAYNEEASLADLLRSHRLHALLQSPLPKRISIVRALSRRDFGTPIWQDDLAAFEQVRHGQLRREIAAAQSKRDLGVLASLESEVCSGQWSLAPSSDIQELVKTAHAESRTEDALENLKELVDPLQAAHSELDVAAAQKLRARWLKYAGIGGVSQGDEIWDLAEPVLDWIEGEERVEGQQRDFDELLATLEQALVDEAPRSSLEEMIYKLQKFDLEIPVNTHNRVRDRLLTFEHAARNRSRLIIIASVTALLLVGALVAWGIHANQQGRILANHIGSLKQLVESASISEAEQYISSLEKKAPEIVVHQEIQVLIAKTHQLREAENGRKTQLAELLVSAKEAGESWDDYSMATSLLRKAEKIANEVEANDVTQVRRIIDGKHREMQESYNKEFAADLAEYVRKCEVADTTDLVALEHLMKDGELLRKRPRVSPQLLTQVEGLIQQKKTQMETELLSRDELELLTNIDRNVGNRLEFTNALEVFSERFPEKSLSRSFKSVVENEATIWHGIERWNVLIDAWSQVDFQSMSPEKAQQLVDEANAITQQHPGAPRPKNLERVLEFLMPITKRVDEEGRSKHLIVVQQITDNLLDLRMALVFSERKYQRYYFNEEVKKVGEDLAFYHFLDTSLSETRIKRVATSTIRNPKLPQEEGFNWASPQTNYQEVVLDRLAQFNASNWEKEFSFLIKELDKEAAMAPQVRAQLLALLLTIGQEGSLPMREAFKRHVDLIQSTDLNDIPTWVDPDDPDVKTRTDATGLLRRLSFKTLEFPSPAANDLSPTAAIQQTEKLLNAMNNVKIGPKNGWVGWLRLDEKDKYTVVFRQGFDTEASALHVVFPNPDDSAHIETIASVQDGILVMERISDRDTLKPGRPVYMPIP